MKKLITLIILMVFTLLVSCSNELQGEEWRTNKYIYNGVEEGIGHYSVITRQDSSELGQNIYFKSGNKGEIQYARNHHNYRSKFDYSVNGENVRIRFDEKDVKRLKLSKAEYDVKVDEIVLDQKDGTKIVFKKVNGPEGRWFSTPLEAEEDKEIHFEYDGTFIFYDDDNGKTYEGNRYTVDGETVKLSWSDKAKKEMKDLPKSFKYKPGKSVIGKNTYESNWGTDMGEESTKELNQTIWRGKNCEVNFDEDGDGEMIKDGKKYDASVEMYGDDGVLSIAAKNREFEDWKDIYFHRDGNKITMDDGTVLKKEV